MYLRTYGSTLMNATLEGAVALIVLRWSSVGPHWALWQNAGVAKIRMNGVWRASAVSTDTW